MRERKNNKSKKSDDLELMLLDLDLESLPDETIREKKKKCADARPKGQKQLQAEQQRSADTRLKRKAATGQGEDMRRKTNAAKAAKGEKRQDKRKRMRNNEFARVTYMFVTLFMFLIGYLVYFNIVESKDVINSPYNVRQDLLADRVVRGKILSGSGEVLAQTVTAEDGTETREYPYGEQFAHVVGYSVKGKSGIESIENFNMLTSNAFFLERLANEFKGEKNIGDNIVTTLDTEVQQAAYEGLGNNKGAAVVMEASTGKILAMVSKPTFNPNSVAANWDSLNSDSTSPLYNRATMGQYAPGSTFKIVTALEYLRENGSVSDFLHNCSSEITVDGTTIHCYNNKTHGEENLQDAFANSCNTAFSTIGLELNYADWKETASDLLFGKELPCDLSYSSGKFQLEKDADTAEVMMTAIGQGDTMVSPYHMAIITSAIANGGTAMRPYLVDQITNYSGATVKKNMPEKYGDLMTSEEAAQLTKYMEAVIEYGTGTTLNGQGYSVAGKTGTAEISMDKSQYNSWFVGFSNVENPDIVVSVVVENAETSGVTGISVAKKIFNAYYN